MDLELKVGDEVLIKCGFNTGKIGFVVHVCDHRVCVDGLVRGAISLYSPPLSDTEMEFIGWNPDIKERQIDFF